MRQITLALLLILGSALAHAAAPAAPTAVPAPPIGARAYILNELTSGQTLLALNVDERREPASLTKLMTAYLSFAALREKRIRPDQMVPISERAWRAEGSRMFVEPRHAVTVDELLHGVIVQSGNDASIALAELIGGSEDAFAALMNREAARLGMVNSHFMNATGLSHPEHYSTANDLARLAGAIIRDFPEYYPYYSIREYRYNNITQYNRNRLLWADARVDGMKTGFTEAAGYCLVTSAKSGERRLLSVVLGTGSDALRASESEKLLGFGFQFFDAPRLYAKNQSVASLRVWKGAQREVKAGFLSDVVLSLPRGAQDRLKVTLEGNEPLVAPLAAGQRIGTLRVALDGRPLMDYPLLALEDVPLANIFVRGWDTLRLWFK
jgi:D-alanyl-D-alanine carboxypeptidase (penicillin-binding protein 5/6)